MRTDSPGAVWRRKYGFPEPVPLYWEPDPNHPRSKVCSKCGEEKPLPEFYLKRRLGRRVAECKACMRERKRRHYLGNRSAVLARVRQYRTTHREEHLAARRRYRAAARTRARTKEGKSSQHDARKQMVRQATHLLRKLGLLPLAENCAVCGGQPTEHHHLDYTSPFAVVSLCRSCHMGGHWAVWRREGVGR